ncbi:hypothetical protein WBG99_06410 [Streptomyces sp. TG1A-60]|uniref:hypothetical protein n=1 Tax=Streptomyces sp. TG1A-60 TaxID=3129111 RepID=UPI0030CD2481
MKDYGIPGIPDRAAPDGIVPDGSSNSAASNGLPTHAERRARGQRSRMSTVAQASLDLGDQLVHSR